MGDSVGSSSFNTILRIIADMELGQKLSAAAAASVFEGDMLQLIPALINAAIAVPHAFDGVDGGTSATEKAILLAFKQAYSYACRIVFYSTIPFGVVAIIAALFIPDAFNYMMNHSGAT
jgi:hypothetical protein